MLFIKVLAAYERGRLTGSQCENLLGARAGAAARATAHTARAAVFDLERAHATRHSVLQPQSTEPRRQVEPRRQRSNILINKPQFVS